MPDGDPDPLEIRKMNALMRYHLKIDPEALSDDDWAKAWQDLKFVLELQNRENS